MCLSVMPSAMAFSDACTFVSKYAFEHDLCLNSSALHEAMYYDIRNHFGLKAQMAASVIRTVTAKYKTIDTQLSLYSDGRYIWNADSVGAYNIMRLYLHSIKRDDIIKHDLTP